MEKTLLVAFGTRPEAIKMCPLINELKRRDGLRVLVYASGQHRDMLDPVLDTFSVVPDFDGNIMKPSQTLLDVTVGVLDSCYGVLERVHPDGVLVHGDTSTAFAVSLVCFYLGIPIYHVEAGLRTWNMKSPFPEEFNRRAIALMASYHFAPTMEARDNLINEGVPCVRVAVTGNTVTDAVRLTEGICAEHPITERAKAAGEKLILLTAHRRENGEALEKMLTAVRRIAEARTDVRFVYPVHPSARVGDTARTVLGGVERVSLCPPLGVAECHRVLRDSYLTLTDSGGIQEEAAALGVPVFIMRETTERPEGIRAGAARLVGTDGEGIFRAVTELLDDADMRRNMSSAKNPYGDGSASARIADILETL